MPCRRTSRAPRPQSGRRRHGGRRGQIAPLLALAMSVLCGFSALSLNTAQDSATRLFDQTVAQAATSTATQVWKSEIPAVPPLTGGIDRTLTGVAMRAQEVAYVGGVTTSQSDYCENNSGPQFDEIFWNTVPTGTNGGTYNGTCSAPASWTYSVEIQIPPMPASSIPSSCSPTYDCLQVLTGQRMTNILGRALGASQTTLTASDVGWTGGAAGITKVQLGALVAAPSAKTVTATFAASAGGTLLVAMVSHWNDNNAAFSGASGGWVRAAQVYDSALGGDVEIWYYPAAPAALTSATFTTTATHTQLDAQVSEWSGVATTSPLDQTGTSTGDAPHTCPNSKTCTVQTAGAVSVSGELGLTNFSLNGGTGPYTPGAGWSNMYANTVDGWIADYDVSLGSGTISEIETEAGSKSTWAAAIATFKPATPAGPEVIG